MNFRIGKQDTLNSAKQLPESLRVLRTRKEVARRTTSSASSSSQAPTAPTTPEEPVEDLHEYILDN